MTLNSATVSLLGLQFNNSLLGDVTLNAGGNLQLYASGIDMSAANKNVTLNSTVTLMAAQTWNAEASRTLTIGGALAGNFNLIKSGSGVLTLKVAATRNSAAVTTTINGGTIRIENATALNLNASGRTIVNDTGVFEVAGVTHNQVVTLNYGGTLRGTGTSGENGVITVAAGGASVTFATVSSSDVFTLANGNNDLIGGDAGTILNISGPGVVNLANNTHTITGTWTVGSGSKLRIGAGTDGILGNTANDVTLNGGTFSLTATSDLNPVSTRVFTLGAGGGTIDVGSGRIITFDDANQITGTGALTKTGVGTLTLSAANNYNGVTTINAGTLQADNSSALSSGDITFTGGKLQYTANTYTSDWATRFKNSTSAITLDPNGQTVTLAGIIDNTNAGLTLNGTGTLALSAANAYTGVTTIQGGTLKLSNAGALSSSTLTLAGGTLDIALDSTLSGPNTTVSGTTTIASDKAASSGGITHSFGTLGIGANTLNITAGANVTGGAPAVTFGTTTLGGAAVFDVASGVGLTLGAINGNQNFTKQNSGTLTLNSSSSRSSGTTTLTGGALVLGAGDALHTVAATLTFSGGTLQLNGTADTQFYGANTVIGNNSVTLVANLNDTGAGKTATLGTLSIGNGTFTVTKGTDVATGTAGVAFGNTTFTGVGTSVFDVASGVNLTLLKLVSGGNFAKQGGGTLTLSLTAFPRSSGTITLSAGTLKNNGPNEASSRDGFGNTAIPLQLNGGTLDLASDSGVAHPTMVGGDVTILSDRLASNPGVTYSLGTLGIGANTLTITAGGNVSSGTAGLTFGTTTLSGSPTFVITNQSGSTTLLTLGAITDNGNTITLKGNGNFAQNAAWASGTAGGLTLDSTYSGTATLSKTNTYTGNTTINGGTLTLASAGAIDNSPAIAVGSGAFFDVQSVSGGYKVTSGQMLTGAGAVIGNTTLNGGATLNPGGVGTVETLVITGAVTFSSSSTNVVDISGTTADRLALTGAVSIASGAVIRFNGTPTSGTTYTLMTAASGITGSPAFTADNLPIGWDVNYNGTSLTLAESGAEMDVRGNGVSITNNDNTPVVGDHTDFGSVGVPGSSNIVRTFTIYNTGTASLSLTGTTVVVVGGAHAGDFTVTLAPSNTVAAGTSTVFNVTFDPSAVGARTGTLSIANNDADENPYTFSIQGTGLANSGPVMDVQGNGVSIADGANTPVASNHTDFGVALAREGTVVRTFTIRNLGDVTLNLTNTPLVVVGGAHSNDFAVTLAPSNSVSAGGSTTFQVTFDPSALGARIGTLSIASDDADENPYDFAIQGTGAVYSWNVATGNWNTAANWNPNGVPSTNDDVLITNGGTNDLDVGSQFTAYPVSSLTVGSGSVLQKDNTSNNRFLTGTNMWVNNGTIRHSQGSGFLGLYYSASTGNVNNGTIRTDGREIKLSGSSWKLNNDGGLIEAVNGGYINFADGGTLTGGRLNIGASSFAAFTRVNSGLTLTSVVVTNAGTFQTLNSSFAYSVVFNTSGGLANTGTAKLSLSASGVNNGWTFNTGTTLNNAPGGTFTIENIRTDTAETSQSYLDLKTGSTLVNSGLIEVKSLTNTYGTAQLRSAINLTNAGTITVDGPASSIQMAGKTNTQTAGTLDIKNGGSVVAAAVEINGGTLAGNGSITGNVTLASGVTRAWSYTNGVAGAMTVNGTLTLPATVTVAVSGGGAFPNPATLFTATSLTGAVNLVGWTITGTNGYAAQIVGNSVVLAAPAAEMDVRGNGLSITNGDSTPAVSDHTDFGSVGVSGASNVLAFTIHNLGTASLNLTGTPIVVVGGTDSNDFTVTLAPTNLVAAGSSTTLQVTFDPSAVGLRSATLSIANNDADENPYTFSIQGAGAGISAPEVDVQGNGVSITDGANTPAASNHTDFGVALVTGGTVVRTFTIRNLGDVILNLTGTPLVAVGGTHSNDFAVTLAPAASVAPNSLTTFQVTFDPSAVGVRSATLSIANDDGDENPYDFAIQGTGAVYSWNVATGNWSTASNWNPASVPSSNHDAYITNYGTNDYNLGGTFAHINTYEITNLTVGSGSVLQKDNTASDRYLKVSGALMNSGTIRHSQGSGFLGFNFSTSAGNANSGTIRADGRGIVLGGDVGGWKLNNTAGLIEAVNGGALTLEAGGNITNGSLRTDATSRFDMSGANNNHVLTSVGVGNAGIFQMPVNSFSRTLAFSTSGGLTNSGTARIALGAAGLKATWTFNSGTILSNAPGGSLIIENSKTNGSGECYVDIKAGATFANDGTISIVSTSSVASSTNQIRSAINLTHAGTITVDGAASSIQMAGQTLTQTAGTLDVKNGGRVVAAVVEINGGTLAGNGSITGNVTLASGVTRAWTYTNGVAGAMTVNGTLTLPATVTVAVSGGGAFPNPATLFTATSLSGASDLSGWTVTGLSGYGVRLDGASVIIERFFKGTVFKIR